MRPTCYIVQEPVRRDTSSGELVPLMNFKRVLEYGEPVVCLPPGVLLLSPAPTTRKLRESLKNFTEDDYLVAVGDPTAIAVAGAICAEVNQGRLKMLKWDKPTKRYMTVQIDLHPERTTRNES